LLCSVFFGISTNFLPNKKYEKKGTREKREEEKKKKRRKDKEKRKER
jgi:hypothetical protein